MPRMTILCGTLMPPRVRKSGVRLVESAVITPIERDLSSVWAIIGICSRLDMATGTLTASRTASWNCNMKPQSEEMPRTPAASSSLAPAASLALNSGAPFRHTGVERPSIVLKMTG